MQIFKKISVAILSTTLSILCIIGIDRLVGALNSQPQSIIFPPNIEVEYDTLEFSCKAKTNSLGFRGGEPGPSSKRIVAIGDSYTYGWGVDESETWELRLQEHLEGTEVFNLGIPGGNPELYIEIAKRSIPLLKPNLVLVCVLQGDDLSQLELLSQYQLLSENKPSERISSWFTRKIIPNLIRSNLKLQPLWDPYGTGQLTQIWSEQALDMVQRLGGEQRVRYDRIDQRMKNNFLTGKINPAIVGMSFSHPDYFLWPLDEKNAAVMNTISKLADSLKSIKEIAENEGARMIVCSMPHGAYNSREVYQNLELLGYNVDEAMLTSQSADSAIQTACDRANVKCNVKFCEFREISKTKSLYFPIDSHLNAEGNALFCELLAPRIEQLVSP